jgi:penicillin-binding protein 1A
LNESIKPAPRIKQFYRRIVAYFTAALNPALSVRSRVFYGIKGLGASGMVGAALLLAYALILIPFTPSISDLRKAKAEQPSILISADGKRLAAFKPMNREWVDLNRISPHVINALIATEDHRFYEHHGVDLRRTAASVMLTVTGNTQGGSTLTQQLARNLYPEEIGRQRTVTRKLKELITALKIEYAYSKKEILATYLNTMPFLYNAYGIEMGARTYFDKPAAKLSVLESATLIGMLKGTSYYNPVLNPERAVKRRNVVLSQMVKRNLLSEANFDKLKNRPMQLNFERQPEALGPAPHFAEHVRKWLIDWADRNDYNIYSDGLVVHTTIDTRLQAIANRTVNRQMEALQAVADVEWGLGSERLISTSPNAYIALRRRVQPFNYFWKSKSNLVDAFIRESGAYRKLVDAGTPPDAALSQLKADTGFMGKLRAEKTRLQAGFVAMDPVTGQIKAWVGSRDYMSDQFDHVAQAKRQPGSTFKPFVYGAALEQGMSPDKRFTDQVVDIPVGDGTIWRPTDVSAPSGRQMTAREGLIYSKNTIAAQVMQEVGPRKTMELARKMGVNQSKLDPVPALALGVSLVSPLEMVSAYGTIAAGGEYRKPVLVSHIADKNGNVLETFSTESERALSSETAVELIDMMRGAVSQGTGQAIRTRFGIQADVAGKTGTTQNNTDGWFILMHPRLVAGSWVGFNDSRVTIRSDHWGQGGNNALMVVGDFFQQTLHSRLIDAGARFPRPRDSFFDSILDKLEDLFGLGKSEPAPAPSAPGREAEPDTPIGDLKQIVKQAREVEQTYEQARRRVEEAVEDAVKVIDDIGKAIERLAGGGDGK